ncbi:MAG: monovalent cation:proton antiporter-2 (CPA2) family protein [Candidatus Eutrophobiaceae bacterium]
MQTRLSYNLRHSLTNHPLPFPMEHQILNYALLLLSLSALAVWLLKRLHLPPLLGYLVIGMILGPYSLNWFSTGDLLRTFAEIGVIFLLFMIGLEFSVSKIFSMRRTVFGLGLAQMFISSLCGATLAWSFGVPWQGALIMGGILALSSTAIVAQQLSEQLETQTPHGKLSISILLFQDLAVVPMLIAIPIFSSGSPSELFAPLATAIGKGILAVLTMYAIGRYALARIFHQVVSARSAELFTLATLLVALTAAWFTSQLGLSLALGSFLAGVILSESMYRQQIEIDIRPFRDVLMGIFFISVGAQCDIRFLYEEWLWVGIFTAGLTFGKGTVIAILARLAGYSKRAAFSAGILLAQGSEFGFAILVVALNSGILGIPESQLIISSIVLSMMLAPLLIHSCKPLAQRLFPEQASPESKERTTALNKACEDLENHVIIFGFQRIGQNLALFLKQNAIRYIALDLDHALIKQQWENGEPVFFGDGADQNVLRQACLEQALVVAITSDDILITNRIVNTVRLVHHKIPIIVRSGDDSSMKTLSIAGANVVIPESFEASMTIARYVLEQLGVSAEEAAMQVDAARSRELNRLIAVFRSSKNLLNQTDIGMATLQLNSIIIAEDDFAFDKSLRELNLERRFGVAVSSLKQGDSTTDSPDWDTCLETGNVLVLQGTLSSLQKAHKFTLAGPH